MTHSRGGYTLQSMKWGFMAHWQKYDAAGAPIINCRIENILEVFYFRSLLISKKPTFRSAIESRKRCVAVNEGFYEWKGEGVGRMPHFVHLGESKSEPELMFLAGFFDRADDAPEGYDFV